MSTQDVQYMLLFLVLVVNSDQFQILLSYTLLLQLLILMRSCYVELDAGNLTCHQFPIPLLKEVK